MIAGSLVDDRFISTTVTAPLERQFGQMPGSNQMTSTSSGGASVITLRFTQGLSLDISEREVRDLTQAAPTASGSAHVIAPLVLRGRIKIDVPVRPG